MSLIKLSAAIQSRRTKHASALLVAPAVAPILDSENATEAAIAGGGFAGLASTVGAPYTWGPEYELARTEAQLKEYRDLLKDPNKTFAEKMKARIKYYNPWEAVKDYKAKQKAVGNLSEAAKAGGKALAKSYARSGLIGLGAAGLAAGYTRFGEDLLGDSYKAPSSLFVEDEGISTEDKLRLLAAGALTVVAGMGYLKTRGSSEEPLQENLNKLAAVILFS
jgi:hypothetical protein